MEIKRVHIAYFSPTGTTKRTLRAVAEGFGCSELSETDWADPKSRAAILKTGPDELVITGMPVYYGRIPSLFHKAAVAAARARRSCRSRVWQPALRRCGSGTQKRSVRRRGA